MIRFMIEGRPEPQGRPRASAVNGYTQVYDPAKSRNYKQVVAIVARAHMTRNALKPYSGPIRVRIDLYYRPPKSYTKKRLREIERGEYPYTKKPDVDNVSKAITDAMNKICYRDDSQIIELIVTKQYGDVDRAEITIEEV